jgi:hypothetical protein
MNLGQKKMFKYIFFDYQHKLVKCPLCGEALIKDSTITNHIRKIHPQRTPVLNV